jgi:hypothetical protein
MTSASPYKNEFQAGLHVSSFHREQDQSVGDIIPEEFTQMKKLGCFLRHGVPQKTPQFFHLG